MLVFLTFKVKNWINFSNTRSELFKGRSPRLCRPVVCKIPPFQVAMLPQSLGSLKRWYPKSLHGVDLEDHSRNVFLMVP
jgi:hypothetical protein